MVFTDPGYRLADGAGHARSSALRGGGGSAFATTQAKCARKLADEEVAFGVDLRGPLDVPGGAGLLEVVVDLGDAGELLDPQAELAYRRRRAEIDDDLEQARATGPV